MSVGQVEAVGFVMDRIELKMKIEDLISHRFDIETLLDLIFDNFTPKEEL